MKNLILLFTLFCVSLFISCEKNIAVEIPCEEECLFTLTDVSGVMVRMECFDNFGIKVIDFNNPETSFNYFIPDLLDNKYKVLDKQVIVSAICRKNILEPQFPDPEFDMNSLYQAELVQIKEKQ